MKSFVYESHTADIRMNLEGGSLEELFEAGLEGMAGLLSEESINRNTNCDLFQDIEVNAMDISTLLIDFLSHVLTLSHIHGVVFHVTGQLTVDHNIIKTRLCGIKHKCFETDIKAVTHHEADVRFENGKWITTVVFDI